MATPWQYAQIQARRDETFFRVRRVFRWILWGAIGGAAVIAGVISHEIPGRSTAATTSNNGAGAPVTSPTNPPAAGATGGTGTGTGATGTGTGTGGTGTGGLPQSPPAPTARPPTVVSGGTGF